jgi:hypothetical protein
MQLQALTPVEALNIQMSTALKEPGDWFEETNTAYPGPYPTREHSFPFKFAASLPQDELSQIKFYTGPPIGVPPGFTKRVKCSLCETSFPTFDREFYRHCRENHVQE